MKTRTVKQYHRCGSCKGWGIVWRRVWIDGDTSVEREQCVICDGAGQVEVVIATYEEDNHDTTP